MNLYQIRELHSKSIELFGYREKTISTVQDKNQSGQQVLADRKHTAPRPEMNTGNPSLSADISPDGKAYEWPLYDLEDKKVMALDEFNIHPEKEAERKIVDWDRTYFLTKYYMP